MDSSETFRAKQIGGKGSRQAPEVAIHDGLIDHPADAPRVPRGDDGGREGEDNGDGRYARRIRPQEEGPPGGCLDVGRVDDGEPPSGQPLLQLTMEDRER